MKRWVASGALSALLLFSGCGGGVTGGDVAPSATAATTLSKIQFLDANQEPLAHAAVTVTPVAEATASGIQSRSFSMAPVSLTTDGKGYASMPGLAPGSYELTVEKDDCLKAIDLEVELGNDNPFVKVVVPLLQEEGVTYDVENDAYVGSLAGTVTDPKGLPVSGAQVALNGGEATNGAIATAVTGNDGTFLLTFHLSKEVAKAVDDPTLQVRAQSYKSKTLDMTALVSMKSSAGIAITLEDGLDEDPLYFHETFEEDSPTLRGWTTAVTAGSHPSNGWHLHRAGLGLVNGAVGEQVKLAPDDDSKGKVPDPAEGVRAFWFGNPSPGFTGKEVGNYMGNQYLGDTWLSGGTGQLGMASAGFLASPSIDLTGVSASTSVYLTFQTWWEVESAKPNKDSYDLMEILYSDDGGATWTGLARLNPLTDPVSVGPRYWIPYSCTGFNSAPRWIRQEPIPLVDPDGKSLAGRTIRLRFSFNTVDEAYNGFRGWLIDDLSIRSGKGTFPLTHGGMAYVNDDEEGSFPAFPAAAGEGGEENQTATAAQGNGGGPSAEEDPFAVENVSEQEGEPLPESYTQNGFTLYDFAVNPAPEDEKGNLQPLTAGATTVFDGAISFTSTLSTRVRFAFRDTLTGDQVGTIFGKGNLGVTGKQLLKGVTGKTAVPSGHDQLALWLIVLDAEDEETVVFEKPIAVYTVL